MFRRAEALDRYEGYLATLGAIPLTKQVMETTQYFLNHAKSIVLERDLSLLFVTVLVQCLVLDLPSRVCGRLLNFKAAAYSDDLLLKRYKSIVIPKFSMFSRVTVGNVIS